MGQRSNYLSRGATLYTLQEGARYFALAETPPDPDEARMAAANLLRAMPSTKQVVESKPFTPRNIHIVLLE